jgi:biotin operon repressor
MATKTRKARTVTTPQTITNAQLEIKIFEAIETYTILSTSQLANKLGMREQDIHERVQWLKKNGWIINVNKPDGWKIGKQNNDD